MRNEDLPRVNEILSALSRVVSIHNDSQINMSESHEALISLVDFAANSLREIINEENA